MIKATLGALGIAAMATGATAQSASPKPTIVLVHGAFADSSSWTGVIRILERKGYTVIAAANPLRSVKSDAQSVSGVLASITTPVVLVGHSYGGSVISEAAEGKANVKALVYVAAFAPDVGENAVGLSSKFPVATLEAALAPPIPLSGGGNDLYIQQGRFHDQFAADVPEADAKLMAAGQRPVTDRAPGEAATGATWKHIPSWFIYGDKDKNIPPQAVAFMADRARSRETMVVKGGSHVVMVSYPDAVAELIEKAASSR